MKEIGKWSWIMMEVLLMKMIQGFRFRDSNGSKSQPFTEFARASPINLTVKKSSTETASRKYEAI